MPPGATWHAHGCEDLEPPSCTDGAVLWPPDACLAVLACARDVNDLLQAQTGGRRRLGTLPTVIVWDPGGTVFNQLPGRVLFWWLQFPFNACAVKFHHWCPGAN